MPQYHSGLFLAMSALGTNFHPPNGIPDITSTPPAIMQSAMPERILAVAIAIVSKPEAQYLFTVTPGTLSVSRPIKEIIRATFKPCSPSGVALPTITSSISSFSKFGNWETMCLITSAARSSARVKRKTPRGALPTAVRYAAMMYASIFYEI